MGASDAAIDAWRDSVAGREITNDSTLDKYSRWVRRFEAWRPGGDPDEDMLREWDSYLADSDFADYPWDMPPGPPAPPEYSFQSRVIALSACKLWLRREYDTRIDTEVQNLALGEPEPFDPTVLDSATVGRIQSNARLACENDHCEAMIRLGYNAIMRAAEVVRVERQDVDLRDETVFVRSAKGSNRITLGIDDRATVRTLRDHIDAIDGDGTLFSNAYDNPWKAKSWANHFRNQHHEAGFHSFARHSAVCNRLNAGEDFGDVFRRARHNSVSMTIRYATVVDTEPPEWASDR